MLATEFDFSELFFRDKDLKVLRFDDYNDEWLDFVVLNRKNETEQQAHDFDIVEGPVADDKIATEVERQDGCFHELGILPKTRLIVGYSESRAKKDKYNWTKGVKRLQTAHKSGTITKENINKRGYNKFLDITDVINQEK